MSKEIKPMVYKNKGERKVLCSGKYRGFDFYILSLGTHPTAYIKLPTMLFDAAMTFEDILDRNVHGGMTYLDNYLKLESEIKIYGEFFGWDYAHCGDYIGGFIGFDDKYTNGLKKWTTEEILDQVRKAIDLMCDYDFTPPWKKTIKKIWKKILKKPS